MTYEIIKALHIIAVICWFAGLFYLPRLFVYHVSAPKISRDMLSTMEKNLHNIIVRPAMAISWVLGFTLIALNPEIMQEGWLHTKLLLVVLLSGYSESLGWFRKKLEQGTNTKSERFFRFYNEVPIFFLIGIIFLIVLRPY